MRLPTSSAIRSQGKAQVRAAMRPLSSTETSSSTCWNGCLPQILPLLTFPCWFDSNYFMSTLKYGVYLNFFMGKVQYGTMQGKVKRLQ